MEDIDLRSDTITLPTEEMRKAIAKAELGDDVYGEDPTVNLLEKRAALLTGKEAALFTPSGTMSNLLAIMAHTRHGDEIILGDEAHILMYEVGGASSVAGVMPRTIPNNEDGTIDIDKIEKTIREDDIHSPATSLLCLENTHNRCGGAVIGKEYMQKAAAAARKHGLKIHLDGARIFNAAIALNVPVKELCEDVDSICFCLSKGLSAPVGSCLCGSAEFIKKTRKLRKMLGGGMRQCGVIAAAGLVALEDFGRLAEDHANAKQLALELSGIDGIEVNPEQVQTNIVLFKIGKSVSPLVFIEEMKKLGVKLTYFGNGVVRAVTNRMVSKDNISEAACRIRKYLSAVK